MATIGCSTGVGTSRKTRSTLRPDKCSNQSHGIPHPRPRLSTSRCHPRPPVGAAYCYGLRNFHRPHLYLLGRDTHNHLRGRYTLFEHLANHRCLGMLLAPFSYSAQLAFLSLGSLRRWSCSEFDSYPTRHLPPPDGDLLCIVNQSCPVSTRLRKLAFFRGRIYR